MVLNSSNAHVAETSLLRGLLRKAVLITMLIGLFLLSVPVFLIASSTVYTWWVADSDKSQHVTLPGGPESTPVSRKVMPPTPAYTPTMISDPTLTPTLTPVATMIPTSTPTFTVTPTATPPAPTVTSTVTPTATSVSAPPTTSPCSAGAEGFASTPIFEYPHDGARLDFEGSYLFQVHPVEGVDGYRWQFRQQDMILWTSFQGTNDHASNRFVIWAGSDVHARLYPGRLEVWVWARVCGTWAEPAQIALELVPIHLPPPPTSTPTPQVIDLVPLEETPLLFRVDLGEPASEAGYRLEGWGEAQGSDENPFPSPSGNQSKRYQFLDADNSIAFAPVSPLYVWELTIEGERGLCNDSYIVFIDGHKLETVDAANLPLDVTYKVSWLIPRYMIDSEGLTVTFRNISGDGCGRAAIYNVKMEAVSA